MKINPQPDDSPEFVSVVEQTVNGIFCQISPSMFLLIKVDNWFGSRWLGFRGKALGIAGLTTIVEIASAQSIFIPPFIPARVVSQRRFAAPNFDELPAGEPLHKKISTTMALRRKAMLEFPETAMAWFSGNTAHNDRGSLMAYVPAGQEYSAWFVGFHKTTSGWAPGNLRGITIQQLHQLQTSEMGLALAE